MSADGAHPAVVLAEEDDDISRILVETLTADGIDPVVVSNGALVLDAVISSSAAPHPRRADAGGELHRRLRRRAQSPRAHGHRGALRHREPERARETLSGNARREVLGKPFDLDDLVAQVRELLGPVPV